MKKILIASHNSAKLDLLTDGLSKLEELCDLALAETAESAVLAISEETFDIVVIDRDLGPVDSDALLTLVKERDAQAVRLLLDDTVSPDSNPQPKGLAHQVMSGRANPDDIAASIFRLSTLQEEMNSEAMQRVISSIDKLPSLPTLYMEINAELRSPSGTLSNVGQIISKDIAMTTKILQVANSAYYGFSQKIVDPEHACSVLGIDTINSLVLTYGIFQEAQPGPGTGISVDHVVKHSTQAAFGARTLATSLHLNEDLENKSFLGGFLHDVGKLVLAFNLPSECRDIAELSRKNAIPWHLAEKEVLGVDHAQVGGYLLGLWGLNEAVATAVRYHHNPSASHQGKFSPLTAVHLANAFTYVEDAYEDTPNVDMPYLQSLGVANQVDHWLNMYRSISRVLFTTAK